MNRRQRKSDVRKQRWKFREVEPHARRIDKLQGRYHKMSSIIAIRLGKEVHAAKLKLAHHGTGGFEAWVVDRLQVSDTQARRWERIYERFHHMLATAGDWDKLSRIQPSALGKLAAENVPEELRASAIAYTDFGLVTNAYVEKLLRNAGLMPNKRRRRARRTPQQPQTWADTLRENILTAIDALLRPMDIHQLRAVSDGPFLQQWCDAMRDVAELEAAPAREKAVEEHGRMMEEHGAAFAEFGPPPTTWAMGDSMMEAIWASENRSDEAAAALMPAGDAAPARLRLSSMPLKICEPEDARRVLHREQDEVTDARAAVW